MYVEHQYDNMNGSVTKVGKKQSHLLSPSLPLPPSGSPSVVRLYYTTHLICINSEVQWFNLHTKDSIGQSQCHATNVTVGC